MSRVILSLPIVLSALLLIGCEEAKPLQTGLDAPPSNCTNYYGHESWKYISTSDMEVSLGRGEDVNARDDNGNTPLHIVARYNREPAQITMLLDNGADVDARNDNEITPLNFALTKLLLGVREVPYPDLRVIALLLEHGADPNAKGYYCFETVHGGPYKSDTTILHSAIDSDLDASVIELLLEHGADPNVPNKGHMPLYEAVARGNTDTAELLLKYGADINAKDGDTTILHSAMYSRLDASVIELLLKYGADIDAKDKDITVLYSAIDSDSDVSVIGLLLEHGADPNVPSRGRIPLHEAVVRGNADTAELLLKYGADIDAIDDHGNDACEISKQEDRAREIRHIVCP